MKSRALSLVLLFGFAFSPVLANQRFESVQRHMGVPFTIVLYASDAESAQKGFESAFARIAEIDKSMSDYDSESELSRLSRASPTSQPIKVSDDLFEVLRQSQAFSEESGGAFDVTVGPLSRLWRRARRQKEMPSDERLKEALEAVGYKFVELDHDTKSVSLLRPEMRLDLGGIAQGYAADEALQVLRDAGIRQAIVDGSGDIAIGDAPPDKAGWKVGIAPLEAAAPPSRYLQLANCGIATSGDAWQFVEINGKRYSHIIDPRTGLGLTRRSSITVVAPDCTQADALATAVSVLSPTDGIRLVENRDQTSALIVYVEDDKAKTCESSRFKLLPTLE